MQVSFNQKKLLYYHFHSVVIAIIIYTFNSVFISVIILLLLLSIICFYF